jgi:hypothetical protein
MNIGKAYSILKNVKENLNNIVRKRRSTLIWTYVVFLYLSPITPLKIRPSMVTAWIECPLEGQCNPFHFNL